MAWNRKQWLGLGLSLAGAAIGAYAGGATSAGWATGMSAGTQVGSAIGNTAVAAVEEKEQRQAIEAAENTRQQNVRSDVERSNREVASQYQQSANRRRRQDSTQSQYEMGFG